MINNVLRCMTVFFCALFVNSAEAVEKGDFLLRFGASKGVPKSDNHELVSAESAASFTFTLAYMLTPNLSMELLGAYPFEHDITLVDGGTKVGQTKHLSPTLTVQYHFMPENKFKPYVGLGVNYTTFFDETTDGPFEGLDLKLGDSWGLAYELGIDFMLNDTWLLNFSIRYIDLETHARLECQSLGNVVVDPSLYSVNLGRRF